MLRIAVLALAAALGGCATTGARDPRDPMEGFNRGVWNFNQAVDKAAIKPATHVYRAVTPVPARRGFSRVLSNLLEPFNFIHSMLQGKPDRAMNALGRFFVNSTIGVGGLADHASDMGMPAAREDFGQTLAVWGVKNSSYLVLPIFGPTTVRDAIGTGTEFAIVPINIVLNEVGASSAVKWGVTGARVLQVRSEAMDSGVDSLLDTSADPYAAARDAYFQAREAEIADRTGANLSEEEEQLLLNQALEDDQAPSDAAPQPEADALDPDASEPPAEAPASEPPAEAAPRLSLVLPFADDIDY